MIFASEEEYRCNNAGVIGNGLVIEIHKSQERANSIDRGRGVPVLDGRKLCRIHVDKTLSNNHSEVFHGGGVKGAF